MPGVKSGGAVQSVRGLQSSAGFSWSAPHNSAVRIYRRGHAGVSVAQQPARIFHRAHSSLLQALGVSAAVAIPAVIRDIHEYLGAILCELPHVVRENGFVTDKDAQLLIAGRQRPARDAARKIPDFFGQTSSKRKPVLERNIFTEGNEMNLVVTSAPLTTGSDQGR